MFFLSRFRFRWIPFIAMLVVVAIGVNLGNWQRHRAAAKIAQQDRLLAGARAAPLILSGAVADPAPLALRRVRVRGRFVPECAVYLDNRPYKGRAGFYQLMPFILDGGSRAVLIERGWLARDGSERTRLPAIATPAGTVTVEGVARLDAGHVMQLGAAPAIARGAIVQNADVKDFAAASGLSLLPLVIEQTAPAGPDDADPALLRDWPAPSLGVDMHRGYAFQWYALAATAFLFFVFSGLRRGKDIATR
jgi:cytochrome oxidase assembly protein ShyY1